MVTIILVYLTLCIISGISRGIVLYDKWKHGIMCVEENEQPIEYKPTQESGRSYTD